MTRFFFKALMFIIPTLLFTSVKGNAQDISGYPIGYCNGEISSNAIVKYAVRDVEVSGAIYISSGYATTVAGNELKSVRFGLGSTRNISEVSVWIRKDLEGSNLGSGKASSFQQGWNEADLDNPVVVSSDLAATGFYIGFSFKQSYTSAGLAALPTPSDGGMWVQCGDDAWENRSAEGTLCLEGVLYGNSLPRLNVHVEGVSVDKWYIVDRGTLSGVLSVRNLATEKVTSLTIQGVIEGIGSPCSTTVDCNIDYNELVKLPFTLSPGYVSDDPRQISGTFTVTSVNGESDEDDSDNSATAQFYVIMQAYPRKVLLEEFTTLSCSNCPRVAGYIHEMLADPAYGSVVEAICHHSGFGTDMYTLDADEQYTWFYNNGGSTYAPAMMLDRANVEYDYTPVFMPLSVADLKAYVDKRLLEPAVVSIEIGADRNTEGNIDVTVFGNMIDKDAFCSNPRITVYLVEDNLVTNRQAGAGAGYVLEHTTRAVNATWGEELSFNNDNTYSYSCTLPYNDMYKWDDMKVVAMIFNMNAQNANDCVVENCAGVTLAQAAGILEVEDTEENQRTIYTIDGRKVKAIGESGLYIIDGKKIMVRNK